MTESRTLPLFPSFVLRTFAFQVGLNLLFDVGIGEKCLSKWSQGGIDDILEVGVEWRGDAKGNPVLASLRVQKQ